MNISSEEINFISSITELQVWNMELWQVYANFRPLFLITTKVMALGQKYSRRRHSWKLFIFIVIILISSAMQNYRLSKRWMFWHLEIITWTVLIAVRLQSQWRDWRKSFRWHVHHTSVGIWLRNTIEAKTPHRLLRLWVSNTTALKSEILGPQVAYPIVTLVQRSSSQN